MAHNNLDEKNYAVKVLYKDQLRLQKKGLVNFKFN